MPILLSVVFVMCPGKLFMVYVAVCSAIILVPLAICTSIDMKPGQLKLACCHINQVAWESEVLLLPYCQLLIAAAMATQISKLAICNTYNIYRRSGNSRR